MRDKVSDNPMSIARQARASWLVAAALLMGFIGPCVCGPVLAATPSAACCDGTEGLKPAPDLRLKMDWGVLVSGPDGHEVIRRVYWSNKATAITADVPSEAMLTPNLWGRWRFEKR